MRRMKAFLPTLLTLLIVLFACDSQNPSEQKVEIDQSINLLQDIGSLTWMNEPSNLTTEGALEVTVSEGTDFFNNPEDSSIVGTAPFLFTEIETDFIATALVEPDFSSQWNAESLMVYLDSLNWIKFAFENSDATGPGIVSVVTKGTSDDANGVALDRHEKIWLKIVRKNSIYALHWSSDGKNYFMTRLTEMPRMKRVKVGVEFQSPVGKTAKHRIHFFSVEDDRVENLRTLK